MRTIAIINQKGGCGKTTTAINLSAMLARHGRRTLLVDMDPQSHCAAGLGVPEQRIDLDVGDAMVASPTKELDLARLMWKPARNLDLLPSRMRLAGLEAPRGALANMQEKEKRLASTIARFAAGYDIVCIDCPPSIGLLTYNALVAADVVLIPVETSFFSLQGATRQVNMVKTLARKMGLHRPIWVLPTIHDEDNAVARDLLGELRRRFGERVLPSAIRRDARLREAASFGQTIIDYAPGSNGYDDYDKLAQWVLAHWQVSGQVDAALEETLAASEPGEDEGNGYSEQPAVASPAAAAPITLPEPFAPSDVTVPHQSPAELKPVTRAEDVARRAQEFLRKVALGRTAEQHPAPPPTHSPAAPTLETPRNVLKLTGEDIRPASISPSVKRLLGAHETNQGVLFVQPLSTGRHVAVAGTFNNWASGAHVMRPNPELGVFELCLRLPPGKFLYRLVIDGSWSADPYNNQCEVNQFDEANSVVVVGEASVQPERVVASM